MTDLVLSLCHQTFVSQQRYPFNLYFCWKEREDFTFPCFLVMQFFSNRFWTSWLHCKLSVSTESKFQTKKKIKGELIILPSYYTNDIFFNTVCTYFNCRKKHCLLCLGRMHRSKVLALLLLFCQCAFAHSWKALEPFEFLFTVYSKISSAFPYRCITLTLWFMLNTLN